MMAASRLDVKPLITHRFGLDAVPAAYDLLASGRERYLGIMLEYDDVHTRGPERTVEVGGARSSHPSRFSGAPRLAFIGAGNYGGRVLIPAFAAAGAALHGVASSGGVTAAHYARKFGFLEATTDAEKLIDDARVDAVVVSTRHDSHARFVCRALDAGKHVFVEKPLALTLGEMDSIESAWTRSNAQHAAPVLMVGFNRRFAPHVVKMKSLLVTTSDPKSCIITVNAGAIPANHWTQDAAIGGGRIIGEGCHFVDLARFLVGSPITAANVTTIGRTESGGVRDDKATIVLGFADGSSATIIYLANGHRSFPKERVEVFCAGRILSLDNFRVLSGFGWPKLKRMRTWRQDKGQAACAKAFVDSIRLGGPPPIPMTELLEIGRVTIALGESARC
jgi:predicted dehydrogenase